MQTLIRLRNSCVGFTRSEWFIAFHIEDYRYENAVIVEGVKVNKQTINKKRVPPVLQNVITLYLRSIL